MKRLLLVCFIASAAPNFCFGLFTDLHASTLSEKYNKEISSEEIQNENDGSSLTLSQSPLVYQYWKLHKFAALGYRRDRQQFLEKNSGATEVKTTYRSRDTVELVVGSHMEYKQILIDILGGYGWLVSGRSDYFDKANGLSFPDLKIKAGYTADARGVVGVRLKLIDRENFGFSLIPAGGYSYSHVQNYVGGGARSPLTTASGFAVIEFPRANQQDWYGPLARASLEFRGWENIILTLFYQYNWPGLRSKTKVELSVYEFTGGDLTRTSLETESTLIVGKGIQRQLGGVDFKYHSKSAWTFGAHFEGSSTYSSRSILRKKEVEEQFLPAPVTALTESSFKEKIHWTEYEVYLFAGYKF